VAYAAYVQARYAMVRQDAALTYAGSLPEEREAWEAAAQAVLTWHQEVTTGRRCADCGVVRPTPSLGLGRWLCGLCVRALEPQEEDTP
jgi:hypothetical protein